jgi:hypothetical protein
VTTLKEHLNLCRHQDHTPILPEIPELGDIAAIAVLAARMAATLQNSTYKDVSEPSPEAVLNAMILSCYGTQAMLLSENGEYPTDHEIEMALIARVMAFTKALQDAKEPAEDRHDHDPEVELIAVSEAA